MDAEKYDEVEQLIEELGQGGLPDEAALVRWLRDEVTRLENNSSRPVQLSKCAVCNHHSLAGFKHCPLCGGEKVVVA